MGPYSICMFVKFQLLLYLQFWEVYGNAKIRNNCEINSTFVTEQILQIFIVLRCWKETQWNVFYLNQKLYWGLKTFFIVTKN